jgi:hypothetical protein
MASVNQVCNRIAPLQSGIELQKLMAGVLADMAVLRAAIIGINAKLDADATVTDTNFGALWNPATLQTTV